MELRYSQKRDGAHRVYVNGLAMGSVNVWFEPDEDGFCVFQFRSRAGRPNDIELDAITSTRDYILKKVYNRLQVPHLMGDYDVPVKFLKLVEYAIEDEQAQLDFVNEPVRASEKRFKPSKALDHQKERKNPPVER